MRKAIVVAAGLLLAGCAGGAGQSADSGSVPGQAQRAADEGAQLAPHEGTGPAVPALPELAPAVIKDASIDLEVGSGAFGEAVDRATSIASRYGGYVLSSTVRGDEAKRGSITLRVPADRFEEAIRDLRGLGTVGAESISGREVGQEFVDLHARLRNARAQQAVLLNLMGEAVTIPQTIHVQRELEGVQLEIEELTGRLRYLRDRTALGTIVVNLAEVGAPAAPGVFGRAWDRAVDVFLGLAYVVIVALGVLVPTAVLGLAGLLVWRRLRPRAAAAG